MSAKIDHNRRAALRFFANPLCVQASEEYGPISHYYLVVVPFANSTKIKHPDYYDSSDLTTNSQYRTQPAKDAKVNKQAEIFSIPKKSSFDNVLNLAKIFSKIFLVSQKIF